MTRRRFKSFTAMSMARVTVSTESILGLRDETKDRACICGSEFAYSSGVCQAMALNDGNAWLPISEDFQRLQNRNVLKLLDNISSRMPETEQVFHHRGCACGFGIVTLECHTFRALNCSMITKMHSRESQNSMNEFGSFEMYLVDLSPVCGAANLNSPSYCDTRPNPRNESSNEAKAK